MIHWIQHRFLHKRLPERVDYWYALVKGYVGSTEAFYAAVEEGLNARRLPGISQRRVWFSEGNLLSARREYLRITRERLVFDVCSAPFGDTWLFSCRFGEFPWRIRWWELLIAGVLAGGVILLYVVQFGLLWGPVLGTASILSLILLMNHHAAGMALDLDSVLIKLPVIGGLYELLLRRHDTYYREDTRIAYWSIVDELVKEKTREFTAAGGVKRIEFSREPFGSRALVERLATELRRAGENREPSTP